MFRYMKRYADGLAILITQRNLNIDFVPFHIFAENPHLTGLVQFIDDRTLNIITHLQVLYDQLSL